MKKIFFSIICFTSIFFILIIPVTGYSADYSIGMYSFYAKWNPSFSDNYHDFQNEPMLMWGPYLSVKYFGKLSLSFLAIQNLSNPSAVSYNYEGTGTAGAYRINSDSKSGRGDYDLTIGYNFTERLNFFAGYKLSAFGFLDTRAKIDTNVNSSYSLFDDSMSDGAACIVYGGAAGLSYTLPVYESFFMTLGTSLLYSDALIDWSTTTFSESSTVLTQETSTHTYKYKGIGSNSTINLSYYLESMNTSIILGGRFQVIHYMNEDSPGTPTLKNDYFYGITLAAVFRMSGCCLL